MLDFLFEIFCFIPELFSLILKNRLALIIFIAVVLIIAAMIKFT